MLTQAILAMIYSEMERETDVRCTFEPLMMNDLRDLHHDFGWFGTVALSAQVCSYLRDRRRAVTLYQLLEPYRDRFVDIGPGWLGSGAHYLALTAATLGRIDEANAHFSHAADAYAGMDAHVWLARTHLEWGRALLCSGETPHAGQGRNLLRRAHAAARHLGLAGTEQRAAILLNAEQ